MRLVIDNRLWIHEAPAPFLQWAAQELRVQNPEFLNRDKNGGDTHGISKELTFLWHDREVPTAPRAFVGQAFRRAKVMNIPVTLEQRLNALPEVTFHLAAKLRSEQDIAVEKLSKWQFGTLCAPTGAGKTVMGLAMIAKRKQPALVVVHTKELLDQWVERAVTFLGMDKKEIGILGGGKRPSIGERLTVGTYQTIRNMDALELRAKVGHLVVDEVHRCPSTTFTDVVERFDTRYQLGLSATPYRRDVLTPLIGWYVGDIRHRIDKLGLIEDGKLVKARVVWRLTKFQAMANPTEQYARVISELVRDDLRTELIANDVKNYIVKNGGPVLVLSDRKDHCNVLAYMLEDKFLCARLTGDRSKKDRKAIVEKAMDFDAIFATGALVGEGFDLPALKAVFLATPLKFSGRVLQYIGRVLRPAKGKDEALIVDYVDAREPVFFAQAMSRKSTYQREHGIEVPSLGDFAPTPQ